jgi:hypothetical protein
MRSKFTLALLSTALSGGLLAVGASAEAAPTAAPAHVAAALAHVMPSSILGCDDWNYACGYRYGFADGRAANEAGLCAQRWHRHDDIAASDQGYRDGFQHYCPA